MGRRPRLRPLAMRGGGRLISSWLDIGYWICLADDLTDMFCDDLDEGVNVLAAGPQPQPIILAATSVPPLTFNSFKWIFSNLLHTTVIKTKILSFQCKKIKVSL